MESMEREPLLGVKKSGRQTHNRYPYSRSSISDDFNETSVYSYCGNNYNIPRPDRRHAYSDTTSTSNEEPPAARKIHRPYFICLVTIANVALLMYICIAGGVETIAFKPERQNISVDRFGYIGSNDSVHKQDIFRYHGVNWFIGPNSSFLVQMGAKFGPCMKKLEVVEERIKNISEKEADYVCCSFHEECGMVKNSSCQPGIIIDTGNCTSPNSHYCRHGVTLRPCCLGLYSQCEVISEQYCLYMGGHWHQNQTLCSQVNCLDGICGMSGVKNETGGKQWYRLITAIFLHLGVIHLIANLSFQIPVGILIEREIGSIRIGLIYLISGIGGNLFCGLFDPLTPQAGASGALFGILALVIVKMVQFGREVKRPCVEALMVLVVVMISFALGTLPYIGNFVHIGGFVFGIFASLVFLPRSNFRRFQTMALYTCFKGVFALLLAALAIVFCIFFAFDKKSKFCSWCQYLDCVPYTEHFCPNMNSDGYANTGG